MRPMEAKVKAVKEFKQPKTKKDIWAFLGLCGYYCRFIASFSTIATLIEFDLEGNAKQSYLDRVVGDLTSGVKRHADKLPGTEYTHLGKGIHTSNRSLEFLYWLRPKKNTPLPMALESYFQEETKYSVIERMGLAIVEGIKHFRVYLEGVPFRIETDHNLLSHLSQLKDSHRRIARWY